MSKHCLIYDEGCTGDEGCTCDCDNCDAWWQQYADDIVVDDEVERRLLGEKEQ